MERREFLESLGIGAAFVLTATCLGSCKSDAETPTPSGIDFNLDLNAAANTSLKNNGGYVVDTSRKIVIARDNGGNYVAVGLTCPHENRDNILFDGGKNKFRCTVHGSEFDLQGKVSQGPADKAIALYKTSLSGTTLRVFS